jgi:hypothetical protein
MMKRHFFIYNPYHFIRLAVVSRNPYLSFPNNLMCELYNSFKKLCNTQTLV